MISIQLNREQQIAIVRPFSIRKNKILSSTLAPEVEQWCEENMESIPEVSISFIPSDTSSKKSDLIGKYENVMLSTVISFSSENDALLFKLRWL